MRLTKFLTPFCACLCKKDGDSYTCGYYYEGGGLIMHVKGSGTAGYRVESTEFIAD